MRVDVIELQKEKVDENQTMKEIINKNFKILIEAED